MKAPVVAYVSCADSGELWVLAFDEASGVLQPLQTVPGLGMVMPLALDRHGRSLYAARRSEPYAVFTFGIDRNTGRVRPLGEAPLPHSMAHLAVDGRGDWLFSASYPGHLIAVSPLQPDGRAAAASQVLATGPNAHTLRPSPDNRFAFSTSLGADQVLQWRFDPVLGVLTPNDPPALPVRQGAGPRHLAFHPAGDRVVLLNELDATLDLFGYDAARGTLSHCHTVSLLPPEADVEPWAAEVRFTPDGRRLYASERRSNTLVGFEVQPERLVTIGRWTTQTQPRSFAIAPSGRWLLSAGQQSHRVGVHRVDPATGELSLAGDCPVGLNPNWVEVLCLDPTPP